MEYSMFGAIREAVAELNREAERIDAGGRIAATITCGELQKLLDNARHSVKLLRQIRVVEETPIQNRYLTDPEFLYAVSSMVASNTR